MYVYVAVICSMIGSASCMADDPWRQLTSQEKVKRLGGVDAFRPQVFAPAIEVKLQQMTQLIQGKLNELYLGNGIAISKVLRMDSLQSILHELRSLYQQSSSAQKNEIVHQYKPSLLNQEQWISILANQPLGE